MSGATKLRDLQAGSSGGMMDSTAMETEEYYNQEGGEWSQKVDTGQLCRVCANPNEYLIPIFDGEGLEHELAMKIQKHLPIKVTETDTLPIHICYQCASTLIAWHDLVISCVEADKKLKELQVEDEDDDDDKGAEMFESHSMDSDPADEVDQPSTSEAQSQVTKAPVIKKVTPSKEKKPKLKMVLVKGPPAGTSGQKAGAKSQLVKALEQGKSKEGSNEDSTSERCSEWREQSSADEESCFVMKSEELDIKEDHNYCIQNEEGKYEDTTLPPYENTKDTYQYNEMEVMQQALFFEQESMTNVSDLFVSLQPSEHLTFIQYVSDDKEQLIDDNSQEEQKELITEQSSVIQEEISDIETEIAVKTESEGEQCLESIDDNDKSSLGYTCEICCVPFTETSDYEVHIASHAQDMLHLCNVCGSVLKSQKTLKKHLETHMDDEDRRNSVCNVCGKAFVNNCSLKKHMSQHTGDRPFVCKVCGRGFISKYNMKSHEACHADHYPYMCNICDETFKRTYDLRIHQTGHWPQMDKYCPLCTISFPSMISLEEHLLSHSEEDVKETGNEPTRVDCHLCDKHFTSKLGFIYHVNAQHASAVYSCAVCNRNFKSQYLLDAHAAVHIKKFNCKICGKELKSKKTLSDHMRIHTGEKPFQCHECGKSFRVVSGLYAHQVLHAKERPYVCSDCGAGFRRRTYLINHTRIHTGEKPYLCDICNRRFAYQSDMKKHRNRHNK